MKIYEENLMEFANGKHFSAADDATFEWRTERECMEFHATVFILRQSWET